MALKHEIYIWPQPGRQYTDRDSDQHGPPVSVMGNGFIDMECTGRGEGSLSATANPDVSTAMAIRTFTGEVSGQRNAYAQGQRVHTIDRKYGGAYAEGESELLLAAGITGRGNSLGRASLGTYAGFTLWEVLLVMALTGMVLALGQLIYSHLRELQIRFEWQQELALDQAHWQARISKDLWTASRLDWDPAGQRLCIWDIEGERIACYELEEEVCRRDAFREQEFLNWPGGSWEEIIPDKYYLLYNADRTLAFTFYLWPRSQAKADAP